MIDALNRYVTTDEVWAFSFTADTFEATLASYISPNTSSGPLTKGVTIRHCGSSATDDLLVSVPGKMSGAFARLYKGEKIFIPISSLTKVTVRSSSGTATFSVVAY